MNSSIIFPKARKKHRCNWCVQPIEIGEVYERQAIFDSGTAYTWKNHKRCSDLASKLKLFENSYGEGVSQEDFMDSIVEYYMELVNFDRKQKLPPFKEMLDAVFKDKQIV